MDMTNEYQAELTLLRKNEKKVKADLAQATKVMKRAVADHKRGRKRSEKELNRIAKRMAILKGRLS